MLTTVLSAAGALVFGAVLGYFVRQLLVSKKVASAEQQVSGIIKEAKEKAESLVEEARKEQREQKAQLDKLEERIIKKEEITEQRSQSLVEREGRLEQSESDFKSVKAKVDELQKQVLVELEKVANLTSDEARKNLLQKVEADYRDDLVVVIQRLEKEKREEIEKKSLDIITTAIQRYARAHVSELTTSVFHLPSDDLKGKIIGREGRNIRTLERAAGVEIVVDETPENVVISSFDPLRREIAKLALDKLIKDGRFQPAKIEEKVEEARQDMNKRMNEIGEEAALEVGVVGLPQEIIQLVGRLHFRTSYGQNVLTHSIEMAYISGMIAAELGANVEVAKKGALLHDIGKAISHEVEGTHVNLGMKLLKKYGISDAVIDAMRSHHEEYPYATPESYIVSAADVISAGRPGARRDTVEHYIKRLQDLEKIATSFEGVKNAYALSAGREIRVFITPEKIDDFGALQLAKNIASKIQSDLKYPGEIKVNVIREMRAVEYAK
ncbi:MAG: ribonuclease Y [bacterium]|nr:ribonuclease Y [bacterium]